MDNRFIHDIDNIKAEDCLKNKTLSAVIERGNKRKRGIRLAERNMKAAVTFACLMLFVVLGIGGYGVYYTEAAAVSVDISPGIELSINRFGRIVGVKAFDTESQQFLEDVELSGMSYEEGLDILLTGDVAAVYLKNEKNVTVTLETKNSEQEKWLERIEGCIDQSLESHHDGVSAEYHCITSDERAEAHHQGMTMGKYCGMSQETGDGDASVTSDTMSSGELNGCDKGAHKESCHH